MILPEALCSLLATRDGRMSSFPVSADNEEEGFTNDPLHISHSEPLGGNASLP